MARKPRVSPAADFIKNSADIIKQLLQSAYTPLARLGSVEAFEAAQERISDLLDVPATHYTRNDFRPIVVNIGNTLRSVTGNKEYVSRFKKDRNGYTFTFNKKPTQGGEINFSSLLDIYPGSTVRGFSERLSVDDKLSIIYRMMSAAGFNFTPTGEAFTAYYAPQIILKDSKSRQKLADRDEIEIAIGDTSGIQGLLVEIGDSANRIHSQPMMNASFQSALRYEVEVSEFGMDVSVTIRPYVDVSLAAELVNYMAETDDKSATDYLVYTWMNNALDRSLARARSSTKNLPAVDLRITSRKLSEVAKRFQVAKPRLNEHGFCINRHGQPMYVPKVDSTNEFMREHSNFSVGEDGYLNYDDVAYKWSNKIILVDWFNDVIVHTQVNGKLAVYRLLGYIPLDKSSEYIFLNSSTKHRRYLPILKELAKVVDAITTSADAEAELSQEAKRPDAYNSGRITQSFSALFANIFTTTLGRNLQSSDPEFVLEDTNAPLIKHMFGIDLEELPPLHQGMCQQIAAYLRAASKNRKAITMSIMDRLVGIEYFLQMAPKFYNSDTWRGIREPAQEESRRRKNALGLPAEIDVPNIDAGGNLKGFMPHQVKVIGDLLNDADSNMTGVAPGGGKTLLQLVDVLLKLEKNPSWRPLIVTKPRLVKNFIAEVNFFTKGKVNIVSLRMSQLRYIMASLKLNTAQAVVSWIKKFPPNTIFICGYTDFASSSKLYDDLEVPDRVLLHDVALPQFLHILRIVGFEIVRLDESHSIKNMASKRSRFAFSALAQSKSKSLLSGTIINNTAVDLIGQTYGINPMAFGSDIEAFKDEYNLPGGLIKSDETSFNINQRLRKFTQMSSATKEDWAFVLPDLYDEVLAPHMTPKQEKFYELLMREAELELRAAMEKDAAEGDDDDADDEEDSEEKFMMQADRSLAKAEQFLVAPDVNQQYVTWKEQPTGDDLISPMVRAIDAELAKIYQDRALDHSNNKAAVFGIHKVASGHFMRHTKFKDLCLHYRAGDEEIMRQFKANPDKYILVADSTSLREGENMQMLSYIFDMQATWTPGDYEQLISRMYRPDPKGQYNKDFVTHYWVTPVHKQIQPTLSTVKLARMISKAISMARFKYEGDPRWTEVSYLFDGLDLLTMNLETIFQSNHNDLAPYFNAWKKFVDWERKINQNTRIKIARELEEENPGVKLVDAGGNVIDRNLFTKMVMREAKSTKMLPGSKRVFTPWERGALPADVHDMSLTILGSDEIDRGMYVMTEYGPAIVHSFTDTQVVVELYGRKKAKIYRSRIAIPNGEGVAKLNAIITNPTAWQNETFAETIAAFTLIDTDASLAPRGSKRTISVKPSPTVSPITPVAVPPKKIDVTAIRKKPKEEEEKLPIEEIYTYIINGMPALAIMDAPSGVENLNWVPVAPFVAMSFNNWTVAENFIESLSRKFAITRSKLDMLLEEMEEFKGGRTMRLTKRVTDQQARNFFMANHRKLSSSKDGRERVDPYWVAIDRNVYLAFSKESHSARVFTWLNTMATKNSSKIKKPKQVPEMHINIFNTLAEAAQDLRALGQAFNIPEADIRQELRELREDIDALRSRRTRPVR